MKYNDYFNLEEDNLKEDECQKLIITFYRSYIKPLYPSCILIVNPFTGKKISPILINRYKALGYERSQPDLMFIYRNKNFVFSGVAIELKRKTEKIHNKQKKLKTEHLKEQSEFLLNLKQQGFFVGFCFGVKHTIESLLNYFPLAKLER